MTLPVYSSLGVAESRGLFPPHGIAKLLKKDRRQVYMWVVRRRNSQFPMPAATYKNGTKVVNLYRLTDVAVWFDGYTPRKS